MYPTFTPGRFSGGLRTVGVLAGHIGDPYFSQIIDGIQAVATEHNFLVTICNTGRDVERELGYFTLLQSHRTEIVIVAGSELNDPRYAAGLRRRIASFKQVAAGWWPLGTRTWKWIGSWWTTGRARGPSPSTWFLWDTDKWVSSLAYEPWRQPRTGSRG